MPAGVGTAPRCRVGQPPGKAYGFRRREPPAPAWTALQEHRHAVGQKQPGPADVGPIVAPPLPEPSRLDRDETRSATAWSQPAYAGLPLGHPSRTSPVRRRRRAARRSDARSAVPPGPSQNWCSASRQDSAIKLRRSVVVLARGDCCARPSYVRIQSACRRSRSSGKWYRAMATLEHMFDLHRLSSTVDSPLSSAVASSLDWVRRGEEWWHWTQMPAERHATAAHRRNSPSSAHRQPGPTVEYDGEQTGIRWSCRPPDRSQSAWRRGLRSESHRCTTSLCNLPGRPVPHRPDSEPAPEAPHNRSRSPPEPATGSRRSKPPLSGCFARRRPGAESTEGGHGGCCQPTFGRAAVFRPRGGR